MQYILIWLIIISLFSAVITIYDKISAKSKTPRIAEKTLYLISLSGGAVAMFITMLIIHHKTRHAKFMLGLPIIILIHIIIISAVASLI